MWTMSCTKSEKKQHQMYECEKPVKCRGSNVWVAFIRDAYTDFPCCCYQTDALLNQSDTLHTFSAILWHPHQHTLNCSIWTTSTSSSWWWHVDADLNPICRFDVADTHSLSQMLSFTLTPPLLVLFLTWHIVCTCFNIFGWLLFLLLPLSTLRRQ